MKYVSNKLHRPLYVCLRSFTQRQGWNCVSAAKFCGHPKYADKIRQWRFKTNFALVLTDKSVPTVKIGT